MLLINREGVFAGLADLCQLKIAQLLDLHEADVRFQWAVTPEGKLTEQISLNPQVTREKQLDEGLVKATVQAVVSQIRYHADIRLNGIKQRRSK